MSEENKQQNIPDFYEDLFNLNGVFGDNWFGEQAEKFARFFGTPFFLLLQTSLVIIWIIINVIRYTEFDPYPFILLNLLFSTQAAYAAPLILLAQTRQADREKAHTEMDAKHREDIALYNTEQNKEILQLLEQNTELTVAIKSMSEQIKQLTEEMHNHFKK